MYYEEIVLQLLVDSQKILWTDFNSEWIGKMLAFQSCYRHDPVFEKKLLYSPQKQHKILIYCRKVPRWWSMIMSKQFFSAPTMFDCGEYTPYKNEMYFIFRNSN